MSGAELYLIASVVSAGATYGKAKSDARNMRSQAYQTEIKGRVDRANYKQQGIEVLKETIKWFRSKLEPHDCGWMYTTIDGIKHRISELRKELRKKK